MCFRPRRAQTRAGIHCYTIIKSSQVFELRFSTSERTVAMIQFLIISTFLWSRSRWTRIFISRIKLFKLFYSCLSNLFSQQQDNQNYVFTCSQRLDSNVSKRKIPNLPDHRPFLQTKSKLYNEILVESWRREEKRTSSIEIRHRMRGGPVRSLHFCFGMEKTVLSGADGGLFRQFRPASRNLAGSICTPRFLYQSTKSVEIVHHNILYIHNILSRRRKQAKLSSVSLIVFTYLGTRLWIFLTVHIVAIDRPSLAISSSFSLCGLR